MIYLVRFIKEILFVLNKLKDYFIELKERFLEGYNNFNYKASYLWFLITCLFLIVVTLWVLFNLQLVATLIIGNVGLYFAYRNYSSTRGYDLNLQSMIYSIGQIGFTRKFAGKEFVYVRKIVVFNHKNKAEAVKNIYTEVDKYLVRLLPKDDSKPIMLGIKEQVELEFLPCAYFTSSNKERAREYARLNNYYSPYLIFEMCNGDWVKVIYDTEGKKIKKTIYLTQKYLKNKDILRPLFYKSTISNFVAPAIDDYDRFYMVVDEITKEEIAIVYVKEGLKTIALWLGDIQDTRMIDNFNNAKGELLTIMKRYFVNREIEVLEANVVHIDRVIKQKLEGLPMVNYFDDNWTESPHKVSYI